MNDMTRHRIAAVLPSFAGGGAERVTLNLLKLLDPQRFQPFLIVLDPQGPRLSEMPESVELVPLNRSRLRSGFLPLIRCLRHIKPAVVFSTFSYINLPLLAARPLLGRTRLVVREANEVFRSLSPRSFRGRLGARLYGSADLVIATSERMQNDFFKLGIPSSRLARLSNPVDEGAIRDAAMPIRRQPGAGLRFVAAGRLEPAKGFDRLVSFMAEMPQDSHCVILGEGGERRRLEEQIRSLGLGDRISLPGYDPNPGPWIAGADAFLMPSRYEGMPNAALEALALGVKVIATPEAGGIGELKDVVIAPAGPNFIRAMREIHAVPPAMLRPSLLPGEFRSHAVGERFNALIAALLEGYAGRHPF